MKLAVLIAGIALAAAGCATRPAAAPPAPPSAGPAAVAPSASAPRAARVMVGTALAMLGQPYRFGGAAPGGFDCSGLVVFAAQSAGLVLPRTAREQLRSGAGISRERLRAGDLVFMRLRRKELHVGIAIDGERFVHAPASGGRVRIDSLAAAPYSTGFLGARRVIDGPDGAAGR